jgi:sugar O-acyltransferase (sialic acid O-acetyltransferase NeuD family)
LARPRRAVILGARHDGSAKVLLDIIALAGNCDVVGFLDDNRELWGKRLESLPILGGLESLARQREQGVECVAFAIGDNHARERALEAARAAGLLPLTEIHPRAVVARGVQLGGGVWVAAGAVINPGARIGDGVVINTGATVDHDCMVGDYCNISPGCHLSGRTQVGRYAFLGTGAITLPDAVIGEGATVGAGAVVVKSVEAGTTVVGVPARVLQRKLSKA